jgi:IrrE N-terminal-like domain
LRRCRTPRSHGQSACTVVGHSKENASPKKPTSPETKLRRDLRQTGLTARAIDAAWPEWWSDEASQSPAATAELRFTLARRLGLAPKSLFDGAPTFIWRDEAKYKHLAADDNSELGALTSFGMALGRMVWAAYPPVPTASFRTEALAIRSAVLASSTIVGLGDLLALSWGLGIAVVHAAVLPLERKRMHAMTVRAGEGFVIILGRESPFTAQAAFTVAHELGHIFLGHLKESLALVDVGDPLQAKRADDDVDEAEADQFALTLLTGSPEPAVSSSVEDFSARQLARAALDAAIGAEVEPGILALCLGHSTGRWRQAVGALKLIPPGNQPVAQAINNVADKQLDWSALSSESALYVRKTLGLDT